MNYVSPLNDISFIEFLRDKKKLSSVLIHYEGSNTNDELTRFIQIEESNINKLLEDKIDLFDLTKTQVYDFENPIVTHYLARINNSEV